MLGSMIGRGVLEGTTVAPAGKRLGRQPLRRCTSHALAAVVPVASPKLRDPILVQAALTSRSGNLELHPSAASINPSRSRRPCHSAATHHLRDTSARQASADDDIELRSSPEYT